MPEVVKFFVIKTGKLFRGQVVNFFIDIYT